MPWAEGPRQVGEMNEAKVFTMALMGGWGLLALVGVAAVIHLLRERWKTEQLRQHGLPAEATVLWLEGTAMRINHSQVFNFLLEVRRPGQAPYQVRLKSRCHDWNVRVIDVGLRLKVHVDPNDPQRLVVLGPVVAQDPSRLAHLLEGRGMEPPSPADPVKALTDVQRLADAGLITPEEYARKRAEILERI